MPTSVDFKLFPSELFFLFSLDFMIPSKQFYYFHWIASQSKATYLTHLFPGKTLHCAFCFQNRKIKTTLRLSLWHSLPFQSVHFKIHRQYKTFESPHYSVFVSFELSLSLASKWSKSFCNWLECSSFTVPKALTPSTYKHFLICFIF